MYVVGGRFPSRGVVDPPRHVIDPRCWCPPTHVGERDSDITQNGERLFFFPSCRRTQRAPRAESGTDKAKQSHDEDTAHNSDTAAVDGAGNRPAEEKAANSAETSYGGEEGRKAMAALHWCHMSSLRWCMPGCRREWRHHTREGVCVDHTGRLCSPELGRVAQRQCHRLLPEVGSTNLNRSHGLCVASVTLVGVHRGRWIQLNLLDDEARSQVYVYSTYFYPRLTEVRADYSSRPCTVLCVNNLCWLSGERKFCEGKTFNWIQQCEVLDAGSGCVFEEVPFRSNSPNVRGWSVSCVCT